MRIWKHMHNGKRAESQNFMSKDNAMGAEAGWGSPVQWAWQTAARLFWLSIGELLLLASGCCLPDCLLACFLYPCSCCLVPAVSCRPPPASCLPNFGHLLCAFWKYNKDSTGHIMHFACLHKYLQNTKGTKGYSPTTKQHFNQFSLDVYLFKRIFIFPLYHLQFFHS